jgi:hypothetical protein
MANGNILRTFGKFYDHLVHFVLILYIFPVLVTCTKKNLATMLWSRLVVQGHEASTWVRNVEILRD